MIGLLKRNKPVVVNFYTDRQDVFDYYKIQPMNHFIPQWFKDIDPKYKVDTQSLHTESNMRGCAGCMTFSLGRMLWDRFHLSVDMISGAVRGWLRGRACFCRIILMTSFLS